MLFQGLYPVVPCRIAARTSAACTALRHCPMLRFAFSAAGGAQLRRPGCAVSHCCADSRRLHCSAALPNAPLRFLRRWRRSAPHTRDPHQCADGVRAAKYIFGALSVEGVKKKLPAAVFKAFLKTKKCSTFSQGVRGRKAKSAEILCGFRAFLTQRTPRLVEKDENCDFSESPCPSVPAR